MRKFGLGHRNKSQRVLRKGEKSYIIKTQVCRIIGPILFHSYAVYATRGTVTDLAPRRDNVFFYTIG